MEVIIQIKDNLIIITWVVTINKAHNLSTPWEIWDNLTNLLNLINSHLIKATVVITKNCNKKLVNN